MKYNFIILIFLLGACKKDNINYNIPCSKPTNDITISKCIIIGNWTWVSELYRDRLLGQYILRTPQTEGFTRQLIAGNATLEYFKNNAFEQKYRYELVIEKSITNYPDDSTNVLVFKDHTTGQRSNYVHYKICNDTLTLNFQIRSDIAGIEKWKKITKMKILKFIKADLFFVFTTLHLTFLINILMPLHPVFFFFGS